MAFSGVAGACVAEAESSYIDLLLLLLAVVVVVVVVGTIVYKYNIVESVMCAGRDELEHVVEHDERKTEEINSKSSHIPGHETYTVYTCSCS